MADFNKTHENLAMDGMADDNFGEILQKTASEQEDPSSRTSKYTPKKSQSHLIFYDDRDHPNDAKEQTSTIIRQIQHIFRLVTEHFIMKIIILLFIILDLCFLITILAKELPITTKQQLDSLSLIFSILFLVEIFLRIIGLGPVTFFQNWINLADFIIVLMTFIVTIVTYFLDDNKNTRFISVLRLVRLPRVLHLFRLWLSKDTFINAGRHITSENKRRYRSDGYDLDLCYITERIIAMSFPSSGLTALYRNHISDVAKFLNEQHTHRYRVYNLCEERGYDESYFNNNVERYYVKDHNVPRIEEMIMFGESTRRWLTGPDSKGNIIAVHCRGGKGRTGTMICVAMLECGLLDGDGSKALEYFGARRTDTRLGSKFQGVDTPSQGRFVRYYADLRNWHPYKTPYIPPVRELKIVSIRVHDYKSIGRGDGRDLLIQVVQAIQWVTMQSQAKGDESNSSTPTQLYYQPFGHFGTREKVMHELNGAEFIEAKKTNIIHDDDKNTDILEIDITDRDIVVDREVKLKFDFNRNNAIHKLPPKRYDGCAFFFWFHTYFIPREHPIRLFLDREDLDNPHKKSTWKHYGPKFGIELLFKEVEFNDGDS